MTKHRYVRNDNQKVTLLMFTTNNIIGYDVFSRTTIADYYSKSYFRCYKTKVYSNMAEFVKAHAERHQLYYLSSHVINANGKTLEDALKSIAQSNVYFNHHFSVFVDDDDYPISPTPFLEAISAYHNKFGTPLRGWRGYKRTHGHCYRRPNTQAEIRDNSQYNKHDEDFDMITSNQYARLVRKTRRDLPNAWDDISFSRQPNRSWKRYRKTQYKM